MKYLTFCLFLLLTAELDLAQEKIILGDMDSTSNIQIVLVTAGDTVKIGEDFPIHLLITNRSKRSLFIPKEIDLISNIYPNGLNEVWNGAIVELQIEPSSGFASIIEENTQLVETIKFVKIKPKSTMELYVGDLEEHIRSFNSWIDSDELKIKTGVVYTIQATYMNNRKKTGKEQKTFLGKTMSQKKELLIE